MSDFTNYKPKNVDYPYSLYIKKTIKSVEKSFDKDGKVIYTIGFGDEKFGKSVVLKDLGYEPQVGQKAIYDADDSTGFEQTLSFYDTNGNEEFTAEYNSRNGWYTPSQDDQSSQEQQNQSGGQAPIQDDSQDDTQQQSGSSNLMDELQETLKTLIGDRLILSKQINMNSIHEMEQAIASYCPNANFVHGKNSNGKKAVLAKLPAPLGFNMVFEDGRIQVLNNLTPDQRKDLAHMFHLLGISDFTFARSTSDDFAKDFQDTYNDTNGTPGQEPKRETSFEAKGRKLSNHDMKSAEKALRDSLSNTGKRVHFNTKVNYGLDGSFSFKVYPDDEAMKTSGELKDGKREPQKWDFYVKFKPTNTNGQKGLTVSYATKGNKPLSDQQAKEYIITPLVEAGCTHMQIDPKVGHMDDNGPLIKACAQKGLIPIFPVQKAIFYKIYIETLEKEGIKVPNIKKLARLNGLKQQLLESNNHKKIEEGSEVYDSLAAIDAAIEKTKLNMEKDKILTVENGLKKRNPDGTPAPELKELDRYTRSSIDAILRIIEDKNEEIGLYGQDKLKLKNELLDHVIEKSKTLNPRSHGALFNKIDKLNEDVIKESLIWGSFDKDDSKDTSLPMLKNPTKYNYFRVEAIIKTIEGPDVNFNAETKRTLQERLIGQILTHNDGDAKTIAEKDPQMFEQMQSMRATVDLHDIYKELTERINKGESSSNPAEKIDGVIATKTLATVLEKYYEELQKPENIGKSILSEKSPSMIKKLSVEIEKNIKEKVKDPSTGNTSTDIDFIKKTLRPEITNATTALNAIMEKYKTSKINIGLGDEANKIAPIPALKKYQNANGGR